jgi:hypothetical protein
MAPDDFSYIRQVRSVGSVAVGVAEHLVVAVSADRMIAYCVYVAHKVQFLAAIRRA